MISFQELLDDDHLSYHSLVKSQNGSNYNLYNKDCNSSLNCLTNWENGHNSKFKKFLQCHMLRKQYLIWEQNWRATLQNLGDFVLELTLSVS